MDEITINIFFLPAKSAKDFFLEVKGSQWRVLSSVSNLMSGKGNRIS